MVSKTKKTTKKTATVSTAVKKYVAKKLDNAIEDKYNIIDMTAGGLTSIPSTWVEVNGVNPAQGIAKNQRIGTKIRVKSIEVNAVLAQGSGSVLTDDPYNIMRIVIGKYTGQTATPLATAGITMHQPIKKDWTDARGTLIQKYVDRYVPLEVQSTEKGGGDGYTPALKSFRYYKRFKNFVITYNDDTNNYPNQRLIMSVISDSGAVTNPGFVAGYTVVRYEDA
nr:capsid protein [Cressdnaviricota sp.]